MVPTQAEREAGRRELIKLRGASEGTDLIKNFDAEREAVRRASYVGCSTKETKNP